MPKLAITTQQAMSHSDVVLTINTLGQMADKLRVERDELQIKCAQLRTLITKLHAAKGRYHTQLACCDLFDAVGLKNERPTK